MIDQILAHVRTRATREPHAAPRKPPSIYQGTVFALRGRGTEPSFRYERRVRTTATGVADTHATRDPAGTLIIDESAQLSALKARGSRRHWFGTPPTPFRQLSP